MPVELTKVDYRRTLDFLNYPYDKLPDITRYLDEKAEENGDEWISELQDLLDLLEIKKAKVEEEEGKESIEEIEVVGEQTVKYGSSALLSAYSSYNSNRAKLCRLTGLSIAPVGTEILR